MRTRCRVTRFGHSAGGGPCHWSNSPDTPRCSASWVTPHSHSLSRSWNSQKWKNKLKLKSMQIIFPSFNWQARLYFTISPWHLPKLLGPDVGHVVLLQHDVDGEDARLNEVQRGNWHLHLLHVVEKVETTIFIFYLQRSLPNIERNLVCQEIDFIWNAE